MNENQYDIAIIGAGASGMMLAANLDLEGSRGIVLEGSSCIGSKLLMSGGGHCNITHGGSIKDFVFAYGSEGQALRRCLYRHSNVELARWLIGHGIELADENGDPVEASYGSKGIDNEGRIFPASMRSRDVLDALEVEADLNGWQIETGTKVAGLRKDSLWEITLANGYELWAENVVIASGGITYPETGSDGSMLEMLENLGLDINEPRSALAPVYVEKYPYAELSGISIPDVTVIKELHELPRRMQRILRERSRGLLGDVRTNVLALLLNQDDFTVSGVDERGMVTAGGVSLDEIDMHTMKAKRFEGLYVIGEALDADGITGGYNLQLCWSTAAAAADDLKKSREQAGQEE